MFAGCTCSQSHSKQQSLLYDEYQYCRYEEGSESALGIVDADFFIGYGVFRQLVLFFGGIARTFYFDFSIHLK